MRNGWNSPGRSAVRERDLETTGARSMVWAKAGAARIAKRRRVAPLRSRLGLELRRRQSEPRPSGSVLVRVIISARRIHWIQRWGSYRCLALEDDVDRRQNAQGRKSGNQ